MESHQVSAKDHLAVSSRLPQYRISDPETLVLSIERILKNLSKPKTIRIHGWLKKMMVFRFVGDNAGDGPRSWPASAGTWARGGHNKCTILSEGYKNILFGSRHYRILGLYKINPKRTNY